MTDQKSELEEIIGIKINTLLINHEIDTEIISTSDVNFVITSLADNILSAGYIKKSEIRVDKVELRKLFDVFDNGLMLIREHADLMTERISLNLPKLIR